MQRIILSALSIVAVLFMISCDDGTVDGGPTDNHQGDTLASSPIIPLKIGNSWLYKKTDFNESGVQIGAPISFTMQVVRDTTVDNIPGVMLRGRNDETFAANKSDGFYAYDDGFIDRVERLYKYPVVKSDSYYRESGESVIVEDLSRKITVPAGDFNCIVFKVLYADSKYYEVDYFVKGVGLIKIENWAMNSQHVYSVTSSEVLINKNF